MAHTCITALAISLGFPAVPALAQSNDRTPLTIEQAVAVALEARTGRSGIFLFTA